MSGKDGFNNSPQVAVVQPGYGHGDPNYAGKYGMDQGGAPMAMQQVPLTTQPVGGMPGAQMQFGSLVLPPSLSYLASLDRVEIHQELHAVEVLCNWEKNNKYNICNAQGQQFLTAKEDTDCMTRQCFGTIRPLILTLSDMQGMSVISLDRPLKCQGCCCPCCLQEMNILIGNDQQAATIKEIWTCCVPRYEVYNTQEQLLFKIDGDCCYCKCCMDVHFKVTGANGEDAGEILKHWSGCAEICGAANNYTVTFPQHETILNKAILVGAAFLIDLMYYDYKGN